jgi:D-3-phosphoglycerate dehydrogenase / 2-oxoglutarate reductase
VPRVLITEELAERGIDALRAAGHDVDVKLGLSPEDLLTEVVGAHALIIRSATKVTAEVLAAATDLVVVGRAGVGIDNVDVAEATHRGVMVVNAPQSNTLSAAEHTMALLLAQARNVPQADAALKLGRWEKSKWEGVELHGKTLGLLGLGHIGTLVAQRAYSFGMRLVAWDPWLSAERARTLGVELLELDELVTEADFITVHLRKTPDSVGLIGKDLLAKAKPGVRIINAARGGIVDEDALAEAIRDGRVGGAALDVYAEEPTTESPLFELANVVVTPHLAGSTREAQDKAGITIAEQVSLALAGEFVAFAVNVEASEASEAVRPFIALAERLGRIFAELSGGLPPRIDVEYQGALADNDVSLLTLSVLKGVLGASSEEPVSYVNAPRVLKERGGEVRESRNPTAHDYVNLITVRGGDHSVGGTLVGLRGEPRLVMVDDHPTEMPPARNMLVVRNDDRPGMIGAVGTLVGQAGINIGDLDVGRVADGRSALMVMAVDEPLPAEVLDELRAAPGVLSVHAITLA